jgi:hypothetical protein
MNQDYIGRIKTIEDNGDTYTMKVKNLEGRGSRTISVPKDKVSGPTPEVGKDIWFVLTSKNVAKNAEVARDLD